MQVGPMKHDFLMPIQEGGFLKNLIGLKTTLMYEPGAHRTI